ncbi:unnamed protein product, partial [Prunus brigantina]
MTFSYATMMRRSTTCWWRVWQGIWIPATKGKEDAMKFLCHLSKTKKIDMQACMDSIIGRLLRYSLGVVTPPMLAKFTGDHSYVEEYCF